MLFKQLRQLRMIFQFACFENHQLVHGPIKHRDAIVAGEPRRVDESVDIRSGVRAARADIQSARWEPPSPHLPSGLRPLLHPCANQARLHRI
jgi:hypothetical protein